MRTKLDKLDQIKKEQDAERVDTITLEKPNFHLGSPEEDEISLSELIDQAKFAINNLPKLVETFINRLRNREEGYYKVRKEHQVT